MVSCEALKSMKTMAEDKKKRSFLIKDSTCIGGLVLVLSNPDNGVLRLALETISLLADTPEHRSILRNFLGMQEQIDAVLERKDGEDIENLAKEVRLKLTLHADSAPLMDSFNISSGSSMQHVLKGGVKLSKTIMLQLKGLTNKCDRDICMRLLLQVRGVISITFDMNKKRCIVRAKPEVRPETLVSAVVKTQSVYAQQVVKTGTGEELFLSFGIHHQKQEKENDSNLPDYLPEEEELQPVDDQAIAKNEVEAKPTGWLSSAANFLTNSFFW